MSIIKDSDSKCYKDSSRSFDFGRSSYTKNSQSDNNNSFHNKRTQPSSSCAIFSVCASRRQEEVIVWGLVCSVFGKYD